MHNIFTTLSSFSSKEAISFFPRGIRSKDLTGKSCATAPVALDKDRSFETMTAINLFLLQSLKNLIHDCNLQVIN